MRAALTQASCIKNNKRPGIPGDFAICVQDTGSTEGSWCLGGNNNRLIAQSDYITAQCSAQDGFFPLLS